MKLVLTLAAVLWAGIGANLFLPAQTSSGSNQNAHAHNGLDGSSYASIKGGYTGEMADFIQKKWFADLHSEQSTASGTVEIECAVKRNGKLGSVEVKQSSGSRDLDRAAISAAKAAPPLKDLPGDFKGARFGLTLLYNLPSTPDRPVCNSLEPSPYKKVGGSVSAPRILKEADAEFSEDARRSKYQGKVQISLTVSADGNPTDICLERGAGNGLDENAVAAAKNYRFQPATENGSPVPVRLSVEIEFRLY